jgi:hypothetical protein
MDAARAVLRKLTGRATKEAVERAALEAAEKASRQGGKHGSREAVEKAAQEAAEQASRGAPLGPAAGGAPRNAQLAGKTHQRTGVPFDKAGYPDFKAAGVVKTEVRITPTGSRPGDFRAANQAAGFPKTPEGYTWHHHQDGTTMQLVPTDIHRVTGHTGGFVLGK